MRKAILGAVYLATFGTASIAAAQPAPPAPPAAPPPAPPAAASPPAAAAPPPPAAPPAAAVTPPAPPALAPVAPPPPPPPPPAFQPEVPPLSPAVSDGGEAAASGDGHPLAGYHGGLFYLRDPDDNFRLYIQGRAQIDLYNYFGPGVPDTALKSTLFLRRIRPELDGEFLKVFQFSLAGDWGATSIDNPKGVNETSAAAPGAAPTATSGKYASAQTASVKAAPTDVFLIMKACDCLNLQIGQYDAPFTMENRTSDKYLAFMERSLATRNLGEPNNKEIGAMLWGETQERFFNYAVGIFSGDGQNRLNVDNRFDWMGRAFLHPLAHADGAIKNLQLGASIHYGQRDPNYVFYDYNTMTTQGNYAFWSPTYKSSLGTAHILPSGAQLAVAGEVRIPIENFDLTSEFVWINNNTREALEGYQATNTQRLGAMKGYSYYIQLGFWPLGNRDINGLPGFEAPAHVDFKKKDPKEPKQALQLLAKWEQLHLNYDSASRGGAADAKNIDGDIKVNAFSLGANYWATKHVRLTANYVLNMFPGSEPGDPVTPGVQKQSSDQRAVAPAQGITKGVNDDARDNAHILHELLFRVAVAF